MIKGNDTVYRWLRSNSQPQKAPPPPEGEQVFAGRFPLFWAGEAPIYKVGDALEVRFK